MLKNNTANINSNQNTHPDNKRKSEQDIDHGVPSKPKTISGKEEITSAPSLQNETDVINYVNLLLSNRQTPESTVAALLKPTPWDKKISHLAFYLSSKEHFVNRIEKILTQMRTRLIRVITNIFTVNGKWENLVMNYLELPNTVQINSPISTLSCENLLIRIKRILTTRDTESITWLLGNKYDSIFYNLLKPHWQTLQNNGQLKMLWNNVFISLINCNCTTNIKIEILTLMTTLPVSEGWFSIILKYNKYADNKNKSVLSMFSDKYTGERKKAFTTCFELMMSAERSTYILPLSLAEAAQVQELLTFYQVKCFILRPMAKFYQLSNIQKQDSERLRVELDFPFTMRESLVEHQETLKAIFSQIENKSLPPPSIPITENDKQLLNTLYQGYFTIQSFNKSSIVYFVDKLACQTLIQKIDVILSVHEPSNAVLSTSTTIPTVSAPPIPRLMSASLLHRVNKVNLPRQDYAHTTISEPTCSQYHFNIVQCPPSPENNPVITKNIQTKVIETTTESGYFSPSEVEIDKHIGQTLTRNDSFCYAALMIKFGLNSSNNDGGFFEDMGISPDPFKN